MGRPKQDAPLCLKAGRFFLAAALAVLLAGCGRAREAGETPLPQAPQLRVTNDSQVAIGDLVVIFPEGRVAFGDVAAGATTEYQSVPNGVYRYAAYELTVEGRRVQQPVVDWVGEEPVQGQAFTYVINVDPNRSAMQIVQLVQATVDR